MIFTQIGRVWLNHRGQGVGQLVVDSIGSGDAPVVLGVVLLTVTGVVLAGFLSDLAHAIVDPRVRLG